MKLKGNQKIGIFVSVVVIAMIIALNFLKGYDIFKKNYRYYTYLGQVEGLTSTSPVYIRGLKVGSIEDITFNPVKDSFLVKISIKKDYVIPSTSRAEMYSSDLLGGKSLRISLGSDSRELKNGDTLKSAIIPDMISMVEGSIAPLKEKINNIINKLDQTLTAVNSALDSATVSHLQLSVAELHQALSNIHRLSANLNKNIEPKLNATLANLDTLSKELSNPEGHLNQILNNLDKTTGDLASAHLGQTIAALNRVLSKISEPDNSIGMLLNSPQLHNSIDSLVNEINTLVKKIEEKPKKFFKISVF